MQWHCGDDDEIGEKIQIGDSNCIFTTNQS